jgi:DNA mismatch repair protein MutL
VVSINGAHLGSWLHEDPERRFFRLCRSIFSKKVIVFKDIDDMVIKVLPQNLINQIAAGEVIERPSSVIKELVENALDAEATKIEIKIDDGGKSYMAIGDDGVGMHRNELEMCALSHATSKLTTENLFNIQTFGFRGEALPSIASIARLAITSAAGEMSAPDSITTNGWCLASTESGNFSITPSNRSRGTTVEVRDLFFATPARLKFLKSDAAETNSCRAMLSRFALAFHDISFKFVESRKVKFHYKATDKLRDRLADVLGTSFLDNVFEINTQSDELKLCGYIGVPTFNKASAEHQYFFVNHRFVKDKIFASALKSAYAGLMPGGRYAAAVLFLEIPFSDVDVNAHPAKIEVRFRNADRVRSFIFSTLKRSLESFGAAQPSNQLTRFFLEKQMEGFRKKSEIAAATEKGIISEEKKVANETALRRDWRRQGDDLHYGKLTDAEKNKFAGIVQSTTATVYSNDELLAYPIQSHAPSTSITTTNGDAISDDCSNKSNNSGENTFPTAAAANAVADFSASSQPFQIHSTYIVAPHENGLMIIDQHAVAERITLERLKQNMSLDSQTLLLPEVYQLSKFHLENLRKHHDLLSKFGIHFEELAQDLIRIEALPAIFCNCNVKLLMDDIIDELSTFGYAYSLDEAIHRILSKISCHSSLRAGKKLSLAEMNHLINQIKTTQNIAQCCHGRPSYVILSTEDLDKFFERS